jgi:opacity protein-like surface antigen
MRDNRVPLMVLIGAAVGLLAMAAAPASAQVHVQIDGGTAKAAERDSFVAGHLGIKLAFLEVDFEGGHLNNVIPTDIVDRLSQVLQSQGVPVQAHASLPATYVAGRARLISPGGILRPFVSVGGGVARIEPRLDVAIDGVSIPDVFGIAVAKKENDSLVTAGVGVRVPLGSRAHAEIGYRYFGTFSHFKADLNLGNDRILAGANVVYAGIGAKF